MTVPHLIRRLQTSNEESMRAITIVDAGPAGQLQLAELPTPEPKAGELRLRVAYAGLNRADIFQRQGTYPAPKNASPIPGLEVSGWVDAVGADAPGWQLGQEVCALVPGGGYAEQVCVPVGQVMPMPAGWNLQEAACLPEAALTVWLAVIETGRAQKGDAVLLQSGASGIGAIGIPMLKALGMRVYATARNDTKCVWCQEQGAALALPYDTPELAERLRAASEGMQVALDMLGGDHLAVALKCLERNGRLVSIAFLNGAGESLPLGQLLMKNLTWSGVTLRSQSVARKAVMSAALVREVWPRFAAGSWRPTLDGVFGLEEAEKAQKRMEERLHLGKILLKVAA